MNTLAPGAVVDWVDNDAVKAVLDHAAALPTDPLRAELEAIADELRRLADSIDVIHAIGLHADGPLIALRRFVAGEVSTVHSHPWTILVALDGEGTLERWSPDTWVAAERTGARPVVIGEDEAHRQRTSAGVLELVMLRDYGDAYARTDYRPAADELARADFFDAFVTAWTTGDAAALQPLLADDIFEDLHIPHWRVQMQGAANVAKFVDDEEFRAGYHVPDWRATRTADGFVFEVESRFAHGDGEGHAEMCHVMHTAGPAGPITFQSAYCTGIWDERTREGLRQSGGLLRP